MTGPELARLPPLGHHYPEQLRGLACVLCARPIQPSEEPLAEVSARYGDYFFTYRPTACPSCTPCIPRPVLLPALDVQPVAPGGAR
ncbi:hypothetical protein [Streptomyces nodosus]|uniref:hypothetical protein n=1 Tax=Streptomyces nodosus TaxID=40318 RepID=UPI0036E3E207